MVAATVCIATASLTGLDHAEDEAAARPVLAENGASQQSLTAAAAQQHEAQPQGRHGSHPSLATH